MDEAQGRFHEAAASLVIEGLSVSPDDLKITEMCARHEIARDAAMKIITGRYAEPCHD